MKSLKKPILRTTCALKSTGLIKCSRWLGCPEWSKLTLPPSKCRNMYKIMISSQIDQWSSGGQSVSGVVKTDCMALKISKYAKILNLCPNDQWSSSGQSVSGTIKPTLFRLPIQSTTLLLLHVIYVLLNKYV